MRARLSELHFSEHLFKSYVVKKKNKCGYMRFFILNFHKLNENIFILEE